MNIRLVGGPKDGEVVAIPKDKAIAVQTYGDRLTDDGMIYYTINCVNGEYIGTYQEIKDAV